MDAAVANHELFSPTVYIQGHALHERGVQSQAKPCYIDQQRRKKNTWGPVDLLQIKRRSTKQFVRLSVHTTFSLPMLLKSRSN